MNRVSLTNIKKRGKILFSGRNWRQVEDEHKVISLHPMSSEQFGKK